MFVQIYFDTMHLGMMMMMVFVCLEFMAKQELLGIEKARKTDFLFFLNDELQSIKFYSLRNYRFGYCD
jgi:hypothetical protein